MHSAQNLTAPGEKRGFRKTGRVAIIYSRMSALPGPAARQPSCKTLFMPVHFPISAGFWYLGRPQCSHCSSTAAAASAKRSDRLVCLSLRLMMFTRHHRFFQEPPPACRVQLRRPWHRQWRSRQNCPFRYARSRHPLPSLFHECCSLYLATLLF